MDKYQAVTLLHCIWFNDIVDCAPDVHSHARAMYILSCETVGIDDWNIPYWLW